MVIISTHLQKRKKPVAKQTKIRAKQLQKYTPMLHKTISEGQWLLWVEKAAEFVVDRVCVVDLGW